MAKSSVKTIHIKKSKGRILFEVVNYALLALFAIICLLPMLHVLFASLSDPNWLNTHSGLLLWPQGFTLEGYKLVFQNEQLLRGYGGFQQEIEDMVGKEPGNHLHILHAGHHDDLAGALLLAYLPDQLHASQPGHVQVGNHDLRVMRTVQLQSLYPVVRLRHDLHIQLCPIHRRYDACPRQQLILRNQYLIHPHPPCLGLSLSVSCSPLYTRNPQKTTSKPGEALVLKRPKALGVKPLARNAHSSFSVPSFTLLNRFTSMFLSYSLSIMMPSAFWLFTRIRCPDTVSRV